MVVGVVDDVFIVGEGLNEGRGRREGFGGGGAARGGHGGGGGAGGRTVRQKDR